MAGGSGSRSLRAGRLLPPPRGPCRPLPYLRSRVAALRRRRGPAAVPGRRGPGPPRTAGLRRHGCGAGRAGRRRTGRPARRRGGTHACVRRRPRRPPGSPGSPDRVEVRAAAPDQGPAVRQRVAGQRPPGGRGGGLRGCTPPGSRTTGRDRASWGAGRRCGGGVARALVAARGRAGGAGRDRAAAGRGLGRGCGHPGPGARGRRGLRAHGARTPALRDAHRLPRGARDGARAGRFLRHHGARGTGRVRDGVRTARCTPGVPARGTARRGHHRRTPPLELASTNPTQYVRALATAGEAAELTATAGLGDFGWLLQPVGIPDVPAD